MDDFAEAKEIYFNFQGSRGYMSREFMLKTFDSYKVPPDLLGQWFEELENQHLSRLGEPGNYTVVLFLALHDRWQYLEELSAARPMGKLSQKCAYRDAGRRLDACTSESGERVTLWRWKPYPHFVAVPWSPRSPTYA